MERKPKNISLTELALYFDGEARNRLESSSASRREGELLALKDKLLRLDEREFEAAVSTLRRFVADAAATPETPEEKAARKYREAAQLFDKAQEGAPGVATTKVSPV